jgi:hypothetical protein
VPCTSAVVSLLASCMVCLAGVLKLAGVSGSRRKGK